MARAPARPNDKVEDVETPALCLDMDAFEANMTKLATTLTRGVNVRPHAKAHKCAAIALLQVRHGAVGVCCAKTSEAEAMVLGGVADVLVANEVISKSKLRRLAALARLARVTLVVDSAFGARAASDAAAESGVTFPVLVELDVGQNRCGVVSAEEVLALAQLLATLPNVRFAGLQAYHGSAQHIRAHADRASTIASAVERVRETLRLLTEHNIACDIVTGGGTGTYEFEVASGVYTEIQPGSYLFMDADYGRNLDRDQALVSCFQQSLFILSTVISRPSHGRTAVCDAGTKAHSMDSGPPLVKLELGARAPHRFVYANGGDEHGILTAADGGALQEKELELGHQVYLAPGHCDPTVNLYDHFVCLRNGRVEAVWPIVARGPGL